MSNLQRKINLDIFQKYINSWIKKDLNSFTDLLGKEVEIIECFGAQYKGKKECERWFSHWNNQESNKVDSWTILSDYYDEPNKTSIIEWLFNYKYKGQKNQFTGITVLVIENSSIVSIKEFESKVKTYRPFQEKSQND